MDPKIAKERTTFLNDDGECPNENWKYNTTSCQKFEAYANKHLPEAIGTYCCECEVTGSVQDELKKLETECFAKNDDHVAKLLVNGHNGVTDVNSVFCLLKPINQ